MKLPMILVLVGVLGLGVTLVARGGSSGPDENRAQTTYFASGKLESRVEIQDGKRHGRAERWYSNGNRMSDGHYVNGRMEGEWFFWNPDGTNDATRTGTYRDGEHLTLGATSGGDTANLGRENAAEHGG